MNQITAGETESSFLQILIYFLLRLFMVQFSVLWFCARDTLVLYSLPTSLFFCFCSMTLLIPIAACSSFFTTTLFFADNFWFLLANSHPRSWNSNHLSPESLVPNWKKSYGEYTGMSTNYNYKRGTSNKQSNNFRIKHRPWQQRKISTKSFCSAQQQL